MQPALAVQNEADDQTGRSSATRIMASADARALVEHDEDDSSDEAPLSERPLSNIVEVQLPMRLAHKWVAYACRQAGVAKPRWNRVAGEWTTTMTAPGETVASETITLTASPDNMRVRAVVEWTHPTRTAESTTTARRIATAFVTSMRDGMRRRSALREQYTQLNRIAALRGHANVGQGGRP